jgi:hypothetical protein
MKSNRPVKILYNILVQLDYLAGLSVAFMLGASRWEVFFILLAVSLILGFTTVWVYTQVMKAIVKEANGND